MKIKNTLKIIFHWFVLFLCSGIGIYIGTLIGGEHIILREIIQKASYFTGGGIVVNYATHLTNKEIIELWSKK